MRRGFRHPAVVITAQRILDAQPRVIQIVPVTSTVRDFTAEVTIEPDSGNGLRNQSAAQCQQIRAVSTRRVDHVTGNIGAAAVGQIRDTLGLIPDIPG